MKRIFSLLSILAFTLGSAVWIVLLSATPETIANLGELPSSLLYFSTIFALGAGAAVVAFGERCLQFIGALSCIIAFLGLAAFHSTHTHDEPVVAETEVVATEH